MIKLALLAVLAFVAAEAAPSGYGYGGHGYGGYGYGGYGYNHGAPSFNEAGVNAHNAHRQLSVNAKAEWIGRSSGTAYKDGVPGTPLGVTGYGHHGHYGGHYGGYGGHYGGHRGAY